MKLIKHTLVGASCLFVAVDEPFDIGDDADSIVQRGWLETLEGAQEKNILIDKACTAHRFTEEKTGPFSVRPVGTPVS